MKDTEHTKAVENLYFGFLQAWNERNSRAMADHFTEDGEMVGYDGSQAFGPEEIHAHLEPIFSSFPTPPYYAKVKNVSFLSDDAGMVPVGKKELSQELNTHHTVIAVRVEGKWFIKLFQNTPAQFHGRPELLDQMTEELRGLLPK
ncbi:SgcJ/EcaC family oxidoreductase [Fictibacillus nanhaiensis]|uniref:SgcJ/EcaC family oxidoreductase n=1 Tax=Fictibacillus nanhaiensis TaxID=742169 RepID=UPI003C2952EF